jgi:hypothetical protein
MAYVLAASAGGAGLYQLGTGNEAKTGFSEFMGFAANSAGASDETVETVETTAALAEIFGASFYSLTGLTDDMAERLAPVLYRKLIQTPLALSADEVGDQTVKDGE